jgi:hypothetical protein
VTAATALDQTLSDPHGALDFPADLVETMTTDQVVGLLLLRMRALLDRGLEPGEALIAAARLSHVQPR